MFRKVTDNVVLYIYINFRKFIAFCTFIFTKNITKILQKYYKNITKILQKYYKNITKILQKYYKNITKILQKYYKNITKILQKYSKILDYPVVAKFSCFRGLFWSPRKF